MVQTRRQGLSTPAVIDQIKLARLSQNELAALAIDRTAKAVRRQTSETIKDAVPRTVIGTILERAGSLLTD